MRYCPHVPELLLSITGIEAWSVFTARTVQKREGEICDRAKDEDKNRSDFVCIVTNILCMREHFLMFVQAAPHCAYEMGQCSPLLYG